MERPRTHAIEAHGYAATIYLSGAVSVRAVLEALRACEQLPRAVWLLRVDLSSAERLDAGTHRVLAEALRRWRDQRAGVTQVVTAGSGLRGGPTRCGAGAFLLRHRDATGGTRVA